MKSSIFVLLAVLGSSLAWAQVTTPATKAPAPSAQPSNTPSDQLKPRGPEPVAQQDPNRIVATINGQQLTARQAEDLLKVIPANQRRGQDLASLLERAYMLQQFADEAGKLNLDQQSPWKDDIKLSRENILAQAYIQRLTSEPGATSDAAKQYYDSHPKEFEQTKISGILVSFAPPGTPAGSGNHVKTEDQARQKADEIEKKIKAGTDFSTLARTESDSANLAARGGDLGTLTPDTPNVPADIKAAIAKLQPGQVSEPIRIPNGFYIIKVDSRAQEPFNQARPNIVLKQQFEKYKVQVKDPDFFSATAGAPPASHVPSLQRPANGQTPGQPAGIAPKPPAQ
jgi:peptidyl-prolyl cis-trans isomerase C